MKRFIITLWSLITIIVAVIDGSCSVAPAVPRLWDVALHNTSQSDVILSKLCFIETTVQNSFIGTFTVLEIIKNKSCTIQSDIDVVNDSFSVIDIQLETINSKIDYLYNSFITIINSIDSIRTNDFGGTWTALDHLDEVMSSKLDDAAMLLSSIESQIDVLAATQESHFVDTFTALQEISNDELALLIELYSISDELIVGLSQIDINILMAKDVLTTVESNLDIIEVNLEEGFAETFTVLNDLLHKACTILSKTDVLESFAVSSLEYTYTAIAEIESKTCVLETKIDQLVIDVTQINSESEALLNTIDMGVDKTCTIESKIELIDNDLTSIASKLDIVVL